MFLSSALRNSDGLLSLIPAAMEANRSTTSAWESAHRQLNRNALSTIARIDLNVLFGKVAGPEARASRTSPVEYNTDQAFFVVQFLFEGHLIEIGGDASLAHQHALKMDIHLRGIERHAGISGG